MVKYANAHRRDIAFQVGDKVFLKLRPHKQQSVCSRIFQKLAPRYYGPFPVIQKVGNVAYKLQLPAGSRIHPVFHASQLKKAVGKDTQSRELPLGLEQDLTYNYEPVKVLARRLKKQAGVLVPQVLIQWKDKPIEEATWEDAADFASQFPETSLEDKADSNGEDIVRGILDENIDRPRPIITQVYKRRPRAQVGGGSRLNRRERCTGRSLGSYTHSVTSIS
ncbi:hypothetical protein F511_44611 [Dorcoceras hygrometricum]|uniref:Uncharacterized protein n=1 Tax=Dorcoceras hygrometricum TaxID=472368 RepID=A0A2Z6ZXJ7_9LAMI|nr:hypothetical protein F511_44611 [Dorcoceras hygrometricum]